MLTAPSATHHARVFGSCAVSTKDRTRAVKPMRQKTYNLIDFGAAALKARSHLSRLSLLETSGHCENHLQMMALSSLFVIFSPILAEIFHSAKIFLIQGVGATWQNLPCFMANQNSDFGITTPVPIHNYRGAPKNISNAHSFRRSCSLPPCANHIVRNSDRLAPWGVRQGSPLALGGRISSPSPRLR